MFVFVKYTQKHNHKTGSLKAFPKLSFTDKIHHRRHFSSLFYETFFSAKISVHGKHPDGDAILSKHEGSLLCHDQYSILKYE